MNYEEISTNIISVNECASETNMQVSDITANLDNPDVKLGFDMYCHRIKKYI